MSHVSHGLSSRAWWALGCITLLLACGSQSDEPHEADATGGSSNGGSGGTIGGTNASGGVSGTASPGGTSGSSGANTGGSGPAVPVDCDGIEDAGFEVCTASADTCTAVFTNGAGCTAVCAAAGLTCASANEDV